MPTKASITTRVGKGQPLTTSEMDANLTNLRDQSIGFADDTSTVISVDSGNTITIAGAGTVSTALSGTTLTVTGSGISASSVDTLTNKTINSASNTITITESNISDLGAYITASSTATLTNKSGNISQWTNDSGYLTSALANIVEDTTPQLGGSLDVNSQKIVSLTNGTIELEPNGTGNVLADVTGGGSLKIENTHTFTSGFDDIYPGKALTLSDSSDSAAITIDQYNQHSPAPEGQWFSIYYDNTGAYTYPSGATAGDVATFLGYNFTDQACDWTAQGGDLYISALNHTDYSDANIILNTPLKGYKELVHSLTSSSTITVDCSLAQVSRVALATNTQIHFTNLPAGKSHTIVIVSSGSYTASFSDDTSTAIKFPGGAPTITASGTDVVTVFNTGSEILGNIAQDFQ